VRRKLKLKLKLSYYAITTTILGVVELAAAGISLVT